MRLSRVTLALLLLSAAPLAAQTSLADQRQQIATDLERERRMTVAMVDSMPERFFGFKPVPEVRNFAQQIVHAALPVAGFASRAGVGAPPMPSFGDSTVYLVRRAALRDAVNRSYEYAQGVLRGMSDADFVAPAKLGPSELPRWRMFVLAHEHSVWTRGELVSYFRLNGMAPPAFDLFDTGGGE